MDMSTRTLLGVVLTLALTLAVTDGRAQDAVPDTQQSQVKDALQNCYQCHGVGGVSVIPTRPTIAGQKAEYIRRQLEAFKKAANTPPQNRDGDSTRGPGDASQRSDPVMEHMAAGLPDQLIAPIAEAVSQLACDGGVAKTPPTSPSVRPQAANACIVCHGANGVGVQDQVPNLAGQHRAYLRRQLLLIRETAWGAQPREGEAWRSHPIMEAKVARLKIADIDAIARYYSSLDCRGAGPDATQ